MEERQELVTWDVFRRKFLSEYFPDSVNYAKEVEFLQLTQGNKFLAEYAEKFKHLSHFYTMPLDEEWRCKKFENDLRGDLRLMWVNNIYIYIYISIYIFIYLFKD